MQCCGAERRVRGGFQREGEDDLILVAEVHQHVERETLGRGKFEVSSGETRRQRPLDVRRLAGVTGILPVNVPAGVKLEVQAGLDGLAAALQALRGHQQFDAHMGPLGHGGLRVERVRQRADNQNGGNGDKAAEVHPSPKSCAWRRKMQSFCTHWMPAARARVTASS